MNNFKDIKLKLTLRSIILFEKMVGHSFFDLRDEEIPQLIYCVVRSNNSFNYKFSVFEGMLNNKKFAETVVTEFMKIFDLVQELMAFNKIEQPINNEQPKEGEEKPENPMVADLASRLIAIVGVDAHYVMDEMELWEMQDLFKSYEEKEHCRLEEKRLWTYFNLMPHVSKKNFKPTDIITFSWEKDAKEKAVQDDFKKHESIIRSVLGLNKKPVSGDDEPLKEKE